MNVTTSKFLTVQSFGNSRDISTTLLNSSLIKNLWSLQVWKPVTQICNLSIKSGIFPDACKLAKLKQLFKKCSRMDSSNYIAISILPLISKIFEKIIHDQMNDYMKPNMTFYTNISPVLEQNIRLICVFHAWMINFERLL